MPTGFFSLVLHAHLPFVRHPEYPEFLEEDWLYEAITEVYLPLIFIFQNLHEAGAAPRLAINVSPPLCEMLADKLLQQRYTRHLENLFELARKEVSRTQNRSAGVFQGCKHVRRESRHRARSVERPIRSRSRRCISRASGRRCSRDHHVRSDARVLAADLDAAGPTGTDTCRGCKL